jgi:hypothetical protein
MLLMAVAVGFRCEMSEMPLNHFAHSLIQNTPF